MATAVIGTVVVLGGGSAGLLAAISLKKKLPQLGVRVVRSPDIGVIGVGESTTATFPPFIFNYLGISPEHFYEVANPTWKLGIHFEWGPRRFFQYGFQPTLDVQQPDLARPNGFYCEDGFENVNLNNALMTAGKAFVRSATPGRLEIPPWTTFHLYNPQLVAALEVVAKELGVHFIQGKLASAQMGPGGVAAIRLEDGRRLEADLWVDASGFRAELIGKVLNEPFISYEPSLFCDRALVASWDRTDEPILPYTVAETMDAGWCWRIDHQHAVNRGYVYSSRFLSDEDARRELARKNPRARIAERPIKFHTGRHRRAWVDNVLAIGNAGGFVEPLEASGLMMLTGQCQAMVDTLRHGQLAPTPTLKGVYNRIFAHGWDDVRDFLAIHYRYNTRLETPFWTTCREEADVSGTRALREFYAENGPLGVARYTLTNTPSVNNAFGLEGYLVVLVGAQVPYAARHQVTAAERELWNSRLAQNRKVAENGLSAREALALIQTPGFRWTQGAGGR